VFQLSIEKSGLKELGDDLDAETLALLVVGLLRGIALQWLIEGDDIDVLKVRRGVSSLLRRFVG
ncbi:hypothetical protein M3M33_13790, partial [Loigolactobacillus coryniformis]|uniref:hypothetical protein n=1 Tax=Loigolactobacillus coryniformis TaxID=1610 RepID=UPI00201AF01F